MWKVRELTEKVTNMVMNYTEVEAKVREATNDEAWGPTGPQMQELAQSTFYYEQFPEVMGMLWKRLLQDNRAAWRRTYKSLLLLNYLVRNGSERVVTSAREHIYDLRSLENFKYLDEHGKDQGLNIRVKAKDLIDFIQDDNRLREERKKAKKNKDKYVGVSSDSMGFRGSGNSDWDNWGSSRRKEEADFGSRFEDSPNASGDEYEEPVDPVSEYRDEEASPRSPAKTTTISSTPFTPNRNLATTSTTVPPQKKSSKPSKMVDLGAAATFGKDTAASSPSRSQAATTTTQPQTTSNNLLDDLFGNSAVTSNGTSSPAKTTPTSSGKGEDDFDPRAGEAGTTAEAGGGTTNSDFGDFAGAFGKDKADSKGNSEFADFSNFPQEVPNASGGQPSASLLLGMTPAPPATLNPSPAAPTSSNPANNNMDLLQGILGPSPAPAQPAPANTDFSGGLGSLMMTPSPTIAPPLLQPMSLPMIDKGSEDATRTQDTGKDISSHADCKRNQDFLLSGQKQTHKLLEEELNKSMPKISTVVTSLEKVTELLPGPFLPQKYAGVDPVTEEMLIFSHYFYGPTVTFLITNYISNGTLKKNDHCRDLFHQFIEAGYLEENVSVLLRYINETSYERAKVAVDILEKMILSDSLPQCLLRYCSKVQQNEKDGLLWDETVRLLISLPERVANKLHSITPVMLSPKMYCRVIAYHILQAVYFIAEGLKHGVSGNVEPIGKLMGHLCFVSDADAVLDPLVKWLRKWAKDNPIILRISQKLYHHVPNKAKERIISVLTRIADNYTTLYMFLGDSNLMCPKTKYLLCQKFLITKETPNATMVSTIIAYLATSQKNHQLLRSTFMKLLDTWCNKSIMTHASFEQHVHITRGLLTSLAHLSDSDVEFCRHDVIKSLLPGIANHLDSPSHQKRVIGMLVAEEITSKLHKDGTSLKFEYQQDDLTLELKQLANLKQEMQDAEQDCEKMEMDNTEERNKCVWFDDFTKELQDIGILPRRDEFINVGEKLTKTLRLSEEHKPLPGEEIKVECKASGTENVELNSAVQENMDLDSDDDEFQPYDMSADVPEVKVKMPFYPQEVLEYLAEGEADKVMAALKVSEKIVREEVSKMDPELALELTKVVLHLEDKYNTEGFEENRTQTLVALVASHPSQCALYIGGEFYEGNYNLKQRMDIIHTLSRAALELSGTDDLVMGTLASVSGGTIKKKSKLLPKNKMKDVAGCFFYPLIQGLTEPRTYLDLMGSDRFLLCDLLKTLGIILQVTGLCEASIKMAACLLEVTWSLRAHGDATVRAACLEALSAGLDCVPDALLLSLVPGEVVELREWLREVIRQDRERKCQILAGKLAIRLDKCFSQQLGFT
ncbi:hypothetical protein Pmani_007538 [Petrolisthes manimaculis]|uniref:ENTH domain-containing protein n=1 Tax=Petrolisthes manimaculis TaxID=1843537 RepID=A0AAE1UFK3_9EUCA|nr:hypothetical protein Pmani_007538 [Petrolisthes manimaculis]